jgi:hypothetical protein
MGFEIISVKKRCYCMKGWLIHAKTKNLIKQWNINKLELLLYTKNNGAKNDF